MKILPSYPVRESRCEISGWLTPREADSDTKMASAHKLGGHRVSGVACRWRVMMVIMAFLFAESSAVFAQELKKVYFLPQWVPQAQFVGYYVAQELGFYQKRGLEVVILRGGPGVSALDSLTEGKCTFITAWLAQAMQKRAQGVTLVNLAQIVQRSSLMLVAKKSSGISSPQDMDGKKISLWKHDFSIQPLALFRKYKVRPKILTQSYSINLFLAGGVEVASAMYYNEYNMLINAGLDPEELTTFFFFDYGLNFPEDGIYCLESTYQKDPAVCQAFVEASLEGWRYAFSHPEEALDILMPYTERAYVPTNRAHQKWMLKVMKELVLPKEEVSVLGVLSRQDYEAVGKVLQESRLLEKYADYNEFYKPAFQR